MAGPGWTSHGRPGPSGDAGCGEDERGRVTQLLGAARTKAQAGETLLSTREVAAASVYSVCANPRALMSWPQRLRPRARLRPLDLPSRRDCGRLEPALYLSPQESPPLQVGKLRPREGGGSTKVAPGSANPRSTNVSQSGQ